MPHPVAATANTRLCVIGHKKIELMWQNSQKTHQQPKQMVELQNEVFKTKTEVCQENTNVA